MAQTRILRVFAASLLPTQWTRGETATRARPRAPSKHYPLPSSPFSLLSPLVIQLFVPFRVFRGSPPPSSYSEDAWRNRRAGAPKRAIHALPSTFFSLLPTLEAHCIVTTHYLLLSSPYSLLPCPFVSISGSLLLNGRVAEPPRGRAQARHPRTTFSFLLPSPHCPSIMYLYRFTRTLP